MPGIFRFGLNHVLSEIEEVINGGGNATTRKPILSEESAGSRMGAGASERG